MLPYLNQLNLDYIETLLARYKEDPTSLDPTWRFFFDGLSFNGTGGAEQGSAAESVVESREELEHEVKVIELIQGYREMAYLIADVNPLDRTSKTHPLLELSNFGLKDADLDKKTHVGQLLGLGIVPLREIIAALKNFYCSPLAIDIAHIEDPKSRNWIQKRVESKLLRKPIAPQYKQRAFEKLSEAEAFETFIHKRFVGQKRFSIEGNDVLIPMLDYLIDQSSILGANEIILGMAHRGRLNVLANIFGKSIKSMFAEFSGNIVADSNEGDGDVKYHLGYSSETKTFSGNDVHISLVPNPSHLEAINAVVMGITRSKQKIKGDLDRTKTLAVLLHGDASFAGQGSIYEVLNMSELPNYKIGGTIHIIVNNQIGFTTDPEHSRSTTNASDIAKMLEIPIFRVNADEPDAALRAISLALQYRYTFKRDVVIDLVGYRRYGHNEGDEPTFAHPLLYKKIAAHPRVRQIYAERLVADGVVAADVPAKMIDSLYEQYDHELTESKKGKVSPKMAAFGKRWTNLHETPVGEAFFVPTQTAVPAKRLVALGEELSRVPEGFHLHPKIVRFIEDRREMLSGKRGIDWSLGEAFAFGTLMQDGYMVRLAGQDSIRGTFSHRHAAFYDVETGKRHIPLEHIQAAKADLEIFNSLLSEYAALGFEFGQSLANPFKLTAWEAQFGDFANGAQIIIDQFVTSSAFKWQRYSGLVMLLPHGYEGQGPEHSSGRVERFLQGCAQHNMQVCNLTTPAQYFHVMRRQMLRSFRIPLVVMTPKSLLRHPKAVSQFNDFENDVFHEILDDANADLKKTAKRIVLCSGKIYYDLLDAQEKTKRYDVAIIRVEQFYPFPRARWNDLFASYKAMEEVVWCQEEPQNMGGWGFMLQYLPASLAPLGKGEQLRYVGRGRQASPSHGYMHLHQNEQQKIVLTALGEV